MQLGVPVNAVLGSAVTSVTLLDDDSPITTLGVDPLSFASEGDGSVRFTVWRAGDNASAASVDYLTADDTAIAGSDYDAAGPLPVSFGPGEVTKTVNVTLINDGAIENLERFTLHLQNPAGGIISVPSGLALIVDDDGPAAFSTAAISVLESAGIANVSVLRSGDLSATATLDYASSVGTASAADFSATSGGLTFPPGTFTQSVFVAITNDPTDEDDETFTVALSNAVGAAAPTPTQATVTILDDDAAPALGIANTAVSEGGAAVTLNVTLSAPSAKPISVAYATTPGTASLTDYTSTSGVLNFPAGSTSVPITVNIADDPTVEVNETFFVVLSAPLNATFASNVARVLIIDDDGPSPRFSIDSTQFVAENAGAVSFNVYRAGPNISAVTVDAATADDTAVAPTDYSASATTVAFAAGQVVSALTIPIVDDVVQEQTERFFVDLSNPSAGAITTPRGNAIVVDNEGPTTVTPLHDTKLEDAGFASVFVLRSGDNSGASSVDFTTSDNNAVAPDDYATTNGTLSFAALQIVQTAWVSLVQDVLDEADETFNVGLLSPVNTLLGATPATVTITDDDATPTVSFTSTAQALGESAGSATITAHLSSISGQSVTATFAVHASSTATSTDYTIAPSGNTLTFPAGTQDLTITITAVDDPNDEPDGTVVVDLTSATNATLLAPTRHTLTLSDDDPLPIVSAAIEGNESFVLALSSPLNASLGGNASTVIIDDDGPTTVGIDDPAAIAEDAGTVTFTVWRSGPTTGASSVDFATQDFTALAGSDYTTRTGSATFAPGAITSTFSVTILDDAVTEAPPVERFRVNLSNVSGAVIGDAQALATIVDDEGPPGITTADLSVSEAAGSAAVLVFRTGDNSALATVDYTTTTGTAGTADFTPLATTSLGFPPGSVSQTINVAITNDTLDENSESFSLDFANASGAALTTSQAVVTIVDDDAPPFVSVSNTIVGEAAGSVSLNVTLSAASGLPVSVSYVTASGTASAGSDYTTTSGTLNFPAGALSQTITVNIGSDTTVEANETFFVILSAPVNAAIGSGTAQVTIVDDDATTASFSIDDVLVAENGGPAVFTVIRSGANTSAQSVSCATSAGTATSGTDYTALPHTALAFASGQIARTVSVAITNDLTIETNETFFVDLSAATGGATLADNQGLGTIVDNDGPTSFAASATSVTEAAGLAPVFIVRSGDNTSAASVSFGTTAVTAATPSDFTSTSGSAAFVAGAITQTVWVPIISDTSNENNETLTVDVLSPAGASGVVTILDDDPLPTLAIADAFIGESSGSATLTVSLSSQSGKTVSVNFAATNGSATSADYTLASGTLSFSPGQTTATIPLSLTSDAVFEGNETFFVTLSAPTNALIMSGTAQITIVDDEGPPTFSVDDVVVSEAAGTATLTVVRSGATSLAASVAFLTANDTAVAPGDYTGASGTLNFAIADVTKTITVTINQDLTSESLERFFLNLSAPVNATISDSQAIVYLADDDNTAPSLSVLDDSAAENNAQLGLTIVRNGSPLGVASVNFATSALTAGAADYVSASGTAVFLSSQVVQQVFVPLLQDLLDEDDETFLVTLSGESGAVLSGATATATIIDDDATPTFSVNDPASVLEATGASITFTVTMSAPAGRAFTVNYTTANNTALAGSDYTLTAGTATFAVGATTANIVVSLTSDTVNEATESFDLNLTSASSGAVITDATGVGTITNDDAVGFTINSPIASESAGVITFTVTRTNASEQTLSVDYNTLDGTATVAAGDYNAASGTLSFAPAQTTRTFNVTLLSDTINEATQTFAARLSNATGGASVGSDGVATITDDDPIVVSIATPTAITEANTTLGFNVSLSVASEQTVTVDYQTSNGTADSGADYTAIATTTLTFTPGQTLRTINVPILQDALDETFNVALSAPAPSTSVSVSVTNGSAVGTITDEDATPSFRIDDPVASITEAVGATVSFNVVLSAVAGRAFTIEALTANGTATAGNDFTALAVTTLSFPAGTTTVPVTINLVNNNVNEATESFSVLVQNASNAAAITDASAVGTIVDDDAVTFAIDSPAAVNENAGSVVFTVTRSIGSEQALTVDYATQNGTAVQPGDYTTRSGTLSFAPSAAGTTQTFSVPINDDLFDEAASETFGALLSNPTGGATLTGTNPGIATINDNDATPTVAFTLTGSSGNEATTPANIEVSLSAASSFAVTVNYSVTGGTASGAGADYTLAAGTATIPAGSTTTNLSVSIVNDLFQEVDETIIVTLTAGTATNSTIGTNTTHTFTIVDNDRAGPTLSSAAYLDTDSNGRIDHVRLTFNKAVSDATFDGYDATGTPNDKLHPVTTVWGLAGRTNVRLDTRNSIGDGIDDDAVIFLAFDEISAGYDTGATPDVTAADSALRESAGGLCYLYTTAATCNTQSAADVGSASVAETDAAPPIIVIAAGITGTTPLTITFSEPVDTNAATGCSGTIAATNFAYTNGGAGGASALLSLSDNSACADNIVVATLNAALLGTDLTLDTLAAATATTFYDNVGNAMATTPRPITGQVSPFVQLVTAYTATKIRITFSEAMNTGTGATGAAALANYALIEDPVETGCAGTGSDTIALTGTVTVVSPTVFELTTTAAQCSTTTYRLTVANSVIDQNDSLPIVDPKFGNFLGNELLRVVSAACVDVNTVNLIFNKPVLTGVTGTVGRANDVTRYKFTPSLGTILTANAITADTIQITHSTSQRGASYNLIGSNGTDGDGFDDAPTANAIQDISLTEVLQAQPRDRAAFLGCGPPVVTFAGGPIIFDPFGDGSDFGNLSDFQSKVYIGPNVLGDRATRFEYNAALPTALDFAINRDTIGNTSRNTSAPVTYSTFGHAANAALSVAACTENTAARLTACGPDNENGRGVFNVVDLNGPRLFAGGARTQTTNDFDYAYFTNDTDTLLNFFYVDMNNDVGGNTNAMETLLGTGNRLFVGFARGPQRRPDFNKISFNAGDPGDANNCGTAANCNTGAQGIRLNIHAMERFGRFNDGSVPAQGNGAHYVGVEAEIAFNAQIYAANGGHPQTNRDGAVIRSANNNPGQCAEALNGCNAIWTNVTPSNANWASGPSGAHWSLELQKTYDLDPGDKAVPAFVPFGGNLYMARNVCRVNGYDATGSAGTAGQRYDGDRPGSWAADHTGSYAGCHNESLAAGSRFLSRRAQLWKCVPGADLDCDAGDWVPVDGGGSLLGDGYFDFNTGGLPANRTISMLMVNGGYLYVGFDGPLGIQVWRTNNTNPTGENSGWAQIGGTGFGDPTNLQQIYSAISVITGGTSFLYLSAGRLGFPVGVYRQTSP